MIARIVILAGALVVSPLAAQTPAGNDAIFRYRSADRESRLVTRARQEGSVVIYTSLAPTEAQPLADAFERKYGVKVMLWRALSDQVVQRTIAEAQARRYAVDVVETNGPEMEMLAREKLIAELYSPHVADLPAKAIPPHRTWFPDRFNFYVVAYNTTKVRRSEIPATYEGFVDPTWKGRIAVEATDAEWMATLIKQGTGTGLEFFRKLAALKPSVRRGHILLANLVVAGEVPLGLTVYQHYILPLTQKGAPIDFVPVRPVVARPQGIGALRHAPHPHAALLFVDYVLSPEGQKLFESLGRVPASTRLKNTRTDFPFITIDPVTSLDEHDKWEQLWKELFLRN